MLDRKTVNKHNTSIYQLFSSVHVRRCACSLLLFINNLITKDRNIKPSSYDQSIYLQDIISSFKT